MQGLQRFCTEHKIKLSKVCDRCYEAVLTFPVCLPCQMHSLMRASSLLILQIDHMFLTRVCSETAGGLPGTYVN